MSTLDFTPVADAEQFERLLADLLSEKYGVKFQLLGRRGQAQSGIDVVGKLPNKRWLLVQAKNRKASHGSVLTFRDVEDACKALVTPNVPVESFIVATTSLNDSDLQVKTAELSAKRVAEGLCPVEVWGWTTISGELHNNPKTQEKYYPQGRRRRPLLQVAALIATAAVATGLVAAGVHSWVQGQEADKLRVAKAVKQLESFFILSDQVKAQHSKCHSTLVGAMFTYSADFRKSCVTGLGPAIQAVDDKVRELGTTLEASAWLQTKNTLDLMRHDYRQAPIAAEVLDRYEEQYRAFMRSNCSKDTELQTSQARQTREALTLAAAEQLKYYFVLNDFIMPAFAALDAQLVVKARELSGQPVPPELANKAAQLHTLISQRNEYVFPATEFPLTLSVVKTHSARTITTSGANVFSDVEQMRQDAVMQHTLGTAYVGRPGDLDALIKCGVLRPTARRLAGE